ncbi:hypothetical protein [Aeoliella straminimaris]|nr:hypothetical protein [Aeoliella straminimaris]
MTSEERSVADDDVRDLLTGSAGTVTISLACSLRLKWLMPGAPG